MLIAFLAAVALSGCTGLGFAPDGCGKERTHRVADASPFPQAGYRTEGTGATARFVQTWTVRSNDACQNQALAVRGFVNFDQTGYQTCSDDLVARVAIDAGPGSLTNLSLQANDNPKSPWLRLLASGEIDLTAVAVEPGSPVSYVAVLEASLPTSGDLARDQACMRELVQNVELKVVDRGVK